MNYVDANIFILSLTGDVERKKLAEKIISKIINNEINAYTSFLSWDELVYIVRKYFGVDIAIKEGKKFLSFPNVNFLKVEEEIILSAQDLISRYQIVPRDAIHAATAILNHINEIISDDSNFDVINEIKRIPLEKFR